MRRVVISVILIATALLVAWAALRPQGYRSLVPQWQSEPATAAVAPLAAPVADTLCLPLPAPVADSVPAGGDTIQ